MIEQLGQTLKRIHLTIASIESFTVGGFASALGSIAGISTVFRGAAVTYQTMMKEKLLGIEHEKVARYGVVSEEIAKEMALKGQMLFESDICISFTGNSGPSPMENKPVGLCYIGLAFKDDCEVFTLHLQGTREEIKHQAIVLGVKYVIEKLEKWEEQHGRKEIERDR